MKRGIVIESHASRGEKGEGRMRKLMKSFQKRQSIASRVLCFLLVLAMVVTMVPALGGGNSTVQAAENPTVRLYFEKPDDWNIPAFNYWNESDVEVDNGTVFKFLFCRVSYTSSTVYNLKATDAVRPDINIIITC